MKWFQSLTIGVVLPVLVNALAATDEVQDGDPPQSGYLPTHNINPAQVPTWQRKWVSTFTSTENFYAGPIVYTPSGYTHELIILVSNANIVRVIDSITGATIANKTLDPPFSAVDSNCNNVKNSVGVTGTPLLDSSTDTIYFYAKGYLNGLAGPQGTLQGVYKLWALKIPDLSVVPGFPVALSGPLTNDPTGYRYFVAGTVLQRPGLAAIGDSIVAGFGGHCDSFNYTGVLVSVSKSQAKVTDMMGMMVPPGAPANQPLDYTLAKGGKAGIWQGGLGLATDLAANRIFFSTGNGDGAGDNANGKPASGKTPISSLEQAIVNVGVDPVTGLLKQQDYFQPANYAALNSGDKDISSGGVTLLSSVPFSGGGVNRVAICGGKEGVIYVMDADNLGGYKMGNNGTTNALLQTISFPGQHFYSSVGSYPAEGGWIYLCTTGSYLQAWKLTPDAQGRPNFTKVAQSPGTLGCHGTPVVTTNNGQAGTGIVWLADSSKGLVAFQAVPTGNTLVQITGYKGTGGLTKFKRPAFGNNRIYVTSSAKIIAMGP